MLEKDYLFPAPGEKIVDLLDGIIGNAREDIGQTGLWLDAVHFARLCRAPDYAEWARFP